MADAATAPGASDGKNGPRTAAMSFILIAVLIDVISVGLIIPVLPHLVGGFTSSPTEQAFWYGAISFAFGLASFFGAPVLGALSDRYGRRPVLLIGFSGLALSFFVTGAATAIWMLIVVRLFSGAMQANAAVANAYVADITPPEDRARRFGLLGAAFGLGFTLGPVLGGVLGSIDVHLPFFVAGGFALLNCLYGWFVLPESLPVDRRRAFSWQRANPVAALRGLTRIDGVGTLVAVVGLAGLAQMILHTCWVLYGTFKFGWGPAASGWSLFAVGVMTVLVQGGLLRHLLKRYPPERLAAMGLVSSTLAYLAWGLVTEGWMMYVVIGLNVLGYAVNSTVQSMISSAADARSQGQTMGSVASLQSLMAVAAPVIGALLLAVGSQAGSARWLLGLPFFFCAALQAVSTVLAFRHFRRSSAVAAAAT